eukprot:g3369.t1
MGIILVIEEPDLPDPNEPKVLVLHIRCFEFPGRKEGAQLWQEYVEWTKRKKLENGLRDMSALNAVPTQSWLLFFHAAQHDISWSIRCQL